MADDLRSDIENSMAAQDAEKMRGMGPFKYHMSTGRDLTPQDAKANGLDEAFMDRFNAALKYERGRVGGGSIVDDLKKGLQEKGIQSDVIKQGSDTVVVPR